MEPQVFGRKNPPGVALVTALALLVVFMVLGWAWYKYMMLDQRGTTLEAQRTEARMFARAGLQAAAGTIEQALAAKSVDKLLQGETRLQFPIYKGLDEAVGTLVPNENYRGEATVTVADECSKVNLNHAPVAVLMQILGVNSAKARQIPEHLAGTWRRSKRPVVHQRG